MLYNAADSEFVPLLAALEFPPLPAHKFDILHTPRTIPVPAPALQPVQQVYESIEIML